METAQVQVNWAKVVDYAKRYNVEPPKTQYELPGVTLEDHDGVPVAVPPAWHAVVTAKLAFAPDAAILRSAQRCLAHALKTSTFKDELERDAQTYKVVGHNAQMQHLTRLAEETTTTYGERLARGTVIFLRQDFDTIENPFAYWSEGPVSSTPRPGVHFVGMAPSAQLFEQVRREMDSVELQQRYELEDQNVGITKFLVTTHRQNFLLPPRAHRSFPLAEL
jgi:acyl transferase domain-containing protein